MQIISIEWICLKMISIKLEYLKPCNCVNTNEYYYYYWIGVITLNLTIAHKLVVLDRNTWYHITV